MCSCFCKGVEFCFQSRVALEEDAQVFGGELEERDASDGRNGCGSLVAQKDGHLAYYLSVTQENRVARGEVDLDDAMGDHQKVA